MSDYVAKSVKELYRLKDIIPTLIGMICAATIGVLAANYFTFYAGI